jgi:hypothetical protein
MIILKQYLQFHDNPFESFELLQPVLSAWHTEWTDLNRIYETHWDSLRSEDPSTLGHSAAQVNRPAPANLKKVDYYPSAEFLYLVLDVRILDCWRYDLAHCYLPDMLIYHSHTSIHFGCKDLFQYFEDLALSGNLPEIEALEVSARKLHRAYSSSRGIYRALYDVDGTSEWAQIVPCGSPWTPPTVIESSLELSVNSPKKRNEKRSGKEKDNDFGRHPLGDRVLAHTVTFMRDAMMSREMSYAIAEGDVGRVYEVMKVRGGLFGAWPINDCQWPRSCCSRLLDHRIQSTPITFSRPCATLN